MLDFTNEAMVKWYQEQMIRAVKAIGYHGWMYDYGEYTPPNCNASNGDVGMYVPCIFVQNFCGTKFS